MKKGKRYKKKPKNSKIIRFIQLILILIIIYSAREIYKWYLDNKKSDGIMENILEMVEVQDISGVQEKTDSFLELKKVNPDVVAWLEVKNTNIQYPVLKTSNNDYYLSHSFDKSYNGAGWIFMDYKNKFDGTDKNTIIYGHNRRDGSMFGSLKNILKDTWYNNEDNLVINFKTETGDVKYKVFSIYTVENEEYYIKTKFASDAEFGKFVNNIKDRSIKKFDTKVDEKSQILTLSTCADNNKYRVVLHAVKCIDF